MITLVHFHLHDPIMVGKKKTQDVQFYTEVMEAVQTLDAGRRSMYDPDEFEEEQRERAMRGKVRITSYAVLLVFIQKSTSRLLLYMAWLIAPILPIWIDFTSDSSTA